MDLQMLKLYKSWSFVIISYNIAIKKRRYNKNKIKININIITTNNDKQQVLIITIK
jgi:hypothetical protein